MWLKCLLEQSSMWLTSSSTTVCAILALMYMLNPLQVLLHTQLECSNRGVRHLQFNMNLLMPFFQSLCGLDMYVGRNVCLDCFCVSDRNAGGVFFGESWARLHHIWEGPNSRYVRAKLSLHDSLFAPVQFWIAQIVNDFSLLVVLKSGRSHA